MGHQVRLLSGNSVAKMIRSRPVNLVRIVHVVEKSNFISA